MPYDGTIECDKIAFGGAQRGKRIWGSADNIIVLEILQRNGKVKVLVIPARKKIDKHSERL